MKTTIFITYIAITTLISCNSNKNDKHEEEHEEHGTEGVVILNKNQQNALSLEFGTIQMRNLTTVVKTNGQMEVPPASRAEITAIIGGNVKEIKVFHGNKVAKGQLLAILEHPDYITLQEDFAEIASKLEFMEKEYARQKELFESNVGAGKDYQQVKSEYNTIKARYEGLKSRLQLLNLSPDMVKEGHISNSIAITSPINGYINEVNIKVGTYVDAKDKLFTISDNSAIHADFLVYEKDVHLIKEGQKIHFTVSNRPNKELEATIFAIGKEFEANTRAVHIHAKLNEKLDGLIPGMYISGHLHTDAQYTQTVPNDAIVSEGTKSFIFIVDNKALEAEEHAEHEENEQAETGDIVQENDGDLAFRMVEVITGLKDEGYTEITPVDSFSENTRIVMNAAYYLLSEIGKGETSHEH